MLWLSKAQDNVNASQHGTGNHVLMNAMQRIDACLQAKVCLE